MRFLVDSMLPPRVAEVLVDKGHDAVTPLDLGVHDLPDETLIQLAAAQARVIVTENAADFASVTTCPVVLVRKSWWPQASLADKVAAALDQWAAANRDPGPFAHWLPDAMR